MVNNHNCSLGMLKILIKYARKEVETLAARIDTNMQTLKEKCTPEVYEQETSRLNERLTKLEEETMAKKQLKFQRDEADYEQGRNLTFGRRFDHLRGSSMLQGVRQQPARQQSITTGGAQASTVGSEMQSSESDTGESDVSNQSEVEWVKSNILKEFDLMAQGRLNIQRGRGAQGYRGQGRGARGGNKNQRGGIKQGEIQSFMGMRTSGQNASNQGTN
ncbi:hypothetical protein NDU88_001129 [Pleurodeles waltl]|uniref:Uncharacterized protein n=1 Tax=Pleurodeles waltl TaxID=8319 RepID=A0AAV7P716_PLEWA|nr:hypothetical protein NDU88_001129 [Pleurodeles waltl]